MGRGKCWFRLSRGTAWQSRRQRSQTLIQHRDFEPPAFSHSTFTCVSLFLNSLLHTSFDSRVSSQPVLSFGSSYVASRLGSIASATNTNQVKAQQQHHPEGRRRLLQRVTPCVNADRRQYQVISPALNNQMSLERRQNDGVTHEGPGTLRNANASCNQGENPAFSGNALNSQFASSWRDDRDTPQSSFPNRTGYFCLPVHSQAAPLAQPSNGLSPVTHLDPISSSSSASAGHLSRPRQQRSATYTYALRSPYSQDQRDMAANYATCAGPSSHVAPSMMRNFSRPSHHMQPSSVSTAAPSDREGNTWTSASNTPTSSRPPSLSFSNSRDSEANSDVPLTPHKFPSPYTAAATVTNDACGLLQPPGAPFLEVANPEAAKPGVGFVKKLRHAASASNLGRSLTRKSAAKQELEAETPVDTSASFFPPVPSVQAEQSLGNEISRVRKTSYHGSRQPDIASSPAWPDVQGRPQLYHSDNGRKGKPGFWNTLFQNNTVGNHGDTNLEMPQSAPADTTEFGVLQVQHAPPSISATMKRGNTHTGASKAERVLGMNTEPSSKVDRVLGIDETERQRAATVAAQKLARTQDLLAEFALDWKPSPATKPPRSSHSGSRERHLGSQLPYMGGEVESNRTHHVTDSVSSNDSYRSSSTSGSRVSDKPPQLEEDLGLPARELSDDIEAVLRSQRNSLQSVEDVLAVHRQIRQRRSSISHHRKTSSTSSARSIAAEAAKHSLPKSCPSKDTAASAAHLAQSSNCNFTPSSTSHQASASVSSSEYSMASAASSTRSRSTSLTSGSGRSLRWADEAAAIGTLPSLGPRVATSSRPKLTARSHTTANVNTNAPHTSSARAPAMERLNSAPAYQKENQPVRPGSAISIGELSKPASPHPFSFSSQVALRGHPSAGKTSQRQSAGSAHHCSSSSHPSAIASDNKADSTVLSPRERAAKALSVLPPLSSLLEACIIASQKAKRDPWQGLSHRPMGLLSSAEQVPTQWSDYVQAYARGEIDISCPPRPLGVADAPRLDTSVSSEAVGIGLDFAFPMPPTRSDDSQSPAASPVTMIRDLEVAPPPSHSRSSEMSDHPTYGDMKAPQCLFESERHQAAEQTLSSLGVDLRRFMLTQQYRSLRAIVQRLAFSFAVHAGSIQLLTSDEVVVLASCGAMDSEEDVLRTPRADSGHCDESSALGVSLFAQEPCREAKASRTDGSLDAHAILSRHGAPVVFSDLQQDWRFFARTSEPRFYAASTIFSPDGLPIGTVSLSDPAPRTGGLNREEKFRLADASREIAAEFDAIRRGALSDRLTLLDESIRSWCKDDAAPTETQVLISPQSRQANSQSIESALLSTPLTTGLGAPPSPNSIAQRRGAKQPKSLAVLSSSGTAKAGYSVSKAAHGTMQDALRTIASALQVDLAYIAHVSSGANVGQGESIKCAVVKRHDEIRATAQISPDATLHMCALAAAKRGLHFHHDPIRVAQLLGTNLKSATEAPFQTAAVVGCGIVEGGKEWRGTEGWALCVASKSKALRFAPESTVYLLRFASLLAPLMLEHGPKSPSPDSATRRQGVGATGPSSRAYQRVRSTSSARSSGFSSSATSPTSPVSAGGCSTRTGSACDSPLNPPSVASSLRSAHCISPGLRKALPPPPMSPPPNEPLPLLPVTPSPLMTTKKLPTVTAQATPPTRSPPLPPPRTLT